MDTQFLFATVSGAGLAMTVAGPIIGYFEPRNRVFQFLKFGCLGLSVICTICAFILNGQMQAQL
jgi:hypothetical protein